MMRMNRIYEMKWWSYACLVLCVALGVCLTACDDDAHEGEYPLPEGQGAMIIGLESRAEVTDLTLYLFGSDGTAVLCETYDNPRELASGYIPVPAGSYTLVIVANGDPADTKVEPLPEDTTIPDLVEWLKAHAADFPYMLTASEQVEVASGDIERLHLVLTDGTSGIHLSTVRLALSVPGLDLPAYTATRAGSEGKPLRCVAEVYQAGTSNRVHRRVQDCSLQSDGTFLAELSLMPGDYDLRLWADWNGGYYNTDDLGKVTVLTENYVANGETDKKDAYYATTALSIPSSPTGGVEGASVSLERPFAKYRLIATDVEAYYNLIEKGEALPPIEDLQVRVTYEGFFPTGFNVATGKPNDALNTGIHYTSVPTVAEGYDAKVNRQVGADFVLTNGEESFVNVTIQMVDTNTGEAVATVQHVKIPYKRGHLTTVTGHFLTAGKTPGGVQIDTEWGEDIVIEF
ncbi:MAG TPA: FimB/Mfa2 family fimbrial subunit [Candidatus Bacteroides pullicola]|uniref:FimB/Mfa2 family fimbrial subunit n=1 Tax=Candidatus Bacteroides pullicola TaxID=2838475 RepID=A0A9D2CLX1_9BACE|nr:FimB/Mfa2 family fimbrial subunit [Candidatus Bacteroides pullicola]